MPRLDFPHTDRSDLPLPRWGVLAANLSARVAAGGCTSCRSNAPIPLCWKGHRRQTETGMNQACGQQIAQEQHCAPTQQVTLPSCRTDRSEKSIATGRSARPASSSPRPSSPKAPRNASKSYSKMDGFWGAGHKKRIKQLGCLCACLPDSFQLTHSRS